MAVEGLLFGKSDRVSVDDFILRFVRARPDSVEDAWTMLKTSLAWRDKMGADRMDIDFPLSDVGKSIIEYWPQMEFGVVEESGLPVTCECLTLLDPGILFETFEEEDIINFHIYIMERHLVRAQELGRLEGIVVQNVEGLAMYHVNSAVFSLLKTIFAIDEANYPSTLGAIYFIRCPTLFPFMFRMLSPFVDAKTLEKVFVMGHDYSKAPLLPLGNMPTKWGGRSPIEWTKDSTTGLVSQSGNVTKLVFTVGARSKHVVPIKIEQDNACLSWTVETQAADISFGIVRGKTVVEKISRVNSHIEPHSGMSVSLKSGTYEAVFDNEYSWTTAKTVTFEFYVARPLTRNQKKNMKRKQKLKEKKKKGLMCASCKYVFANANASMCPTCGSKEKVSQ